MAYLQEDLFLFLETNLYQSKLVLMQPWKRCIGASFSDWQKEKSGHEIFLNLKSFLFKYNTLFQIFYWKTRRFVSTVTRRGKRYTCFQSMSLIWKRSSKYNWDLVFELLRDICRQYSSLLWHLSKEYNWFFFNQVVIIHGKSIGNAVTSMKFFSPRFWNCIYQLNPKIMLLVTQIELCFNI